MTALRFAAAFAAQPLLAIEIVHRRHHGRVGDLPVGGEFVEDLTHRHWIFVVPDEVHDDRFQVTETSLQHVLLSFDTARSPRSSTVWLGTM